MTSPQTPLYTDDTAAIYSTAGPDGAPALQIVGHQPVDQASFNGWSGLVRQLAAHPNIANVLYAGLGTDGRPSLVVDAAGSALAERLCHTGPLAVGEAVTNASLLALALDSLHQNGLRHGQLAPSTVLFNGFGHPQLSGLDATAPGLAPPNITSKYNPLDQHPGPSADVYALAATTYVSLGGQLPFAYDPGNVGLRNQSIVDLPGVPPQVTGVLRAALNPDPNGRPSAAQLHAELSGVDLPHVPSAAPALPADVIGIQARPVTAGVLEINQAAAGARPVSAAPAPFPTSGAPFPTSGPPGQFPAQGASYPTSGGPGQFPTSGAPFPTSGATSQFPAQGYPAATPTGQMPQWGQQPPAKKSNPLLWAGGAVMAVVVLIGAIVGFNLLNSNDPDDPGPDPTTSAPPVMDEGVRQVDIKNSAVSILQEPDTLSAGQAGKFTLSSEIVYADVDKDNDLDAAGILQFAGDTENDADPWEFVQIWLYDPEYTRVTPVEFEGTWQWTCSELPALEVRADSSHPNAFEISRSAANYCDGASFHTPETIHVEVHGEVPVQNDSGHLSGVINCRSDANSTIWDEADVTGEADPLFLPDPSSGVVAPSSEYTKMVVYYSKKDLDTTINHGYAFGVIYFTDGEYGCGWVPWDVVV